MHELHIKASRDLPEYPKYANKVIYWNEKTKSGRAFILVGYCPDTLDWILRLYLKAQESFPELTLADVICGKIKKSNWCYGFTFISFGVKKKAKGWTTNTGDIDFNY